PFARRRRRERGRWSRSRRARRARARVPDPSRVYPRSASRWSWMQSVAHGRARSRSTPIGPPQRSQVPYVPFSICASAWSICASVCCAPSSSPSSSSRSNVTVAMSPRWLSLPRPATSPSSSSRFRGCSSWRYAIASTMRLRSCSSRDRNSDVSMVVTAVHPFHSRLPTRGGARSPPASGPRARRPCPARRDRRRSRRRAAAARASRRGDARPRRSPSRPPAAPPRGPSTPRRACRRRRDAPLRAPRAAPASSGRSCPAVYAHADGPGPPRRAGAGASVDPDRHLAELRPAALLPGLLRVVAALLRLFEHPEGGLEERLDAPRLRLQPGALALRRARDRARLGARLGDDQLRLAPGLLPHLRRRLLGRDERLREHVLPLPEVRELALERLHVVGALAPDRLEAVCDLREQVLHDALLVAEQGAGHADVPELHGRVRHLAGPVPGPPRNSFPPSGGSVEPVEQVDDDLAAAEA